MPDNQFDINSILNNLIRPVTLRELFENKLTELDISPTAVLDILNIQYRTLNGILDGTQKLVDYTNLIKISSFLQIPKEKVIELYVSALEKNFPTTTVSADKVQFIKENFDLAVLKKAGVLETITDFNHIEKRLLSRLGLKSIFEYKKPKNDVAFSSGVINIKPKNELARFFWISAAKSIFEELSSPYEFDRQALINFFPHIRWHSTNVEAGLVEIIRSLYKLGVTIIYQPPLANLHLRGATFAVDGKPCIVLSNYRNFYATLWWALIHELYHVLFDWEDIKANSYHLSIEDDNEQLSVKDRERMADDFARKYLFSKEKMDAVHKYINDADYIRDVATSNHVDPSFIYVFYAYDAGSNNKIAWSRARKFSPDVNLSLKDIDIPWNDDRPVEEVISRRKSVIYN